MTTYDATFERRLDLSHDSTPSTVHEAPSTTIPQAIARAALTLALLVGMSALFASQIVAILR